MQLTKKKRKEKEKEERKKRKEKKYEECFQFLSRKPIPMSHAHILCFPCQEQKAFPLKVHSLLRSRFHFLCAQSLYYFTPLQYQLLYTDRTILYPVLSRKSKFTFFQTSTGPGWWSVSLFSLTAEVYERFSYIQYFIDLPSVYNLACSKMCYDTVLPGRKSYKCQQVNSHLSRHSSYSQ